jgi:hypothetical protein
MIANVWIHLLLNGEIDYVIGKIVASGFGVELLCKQLPKHNNDYPVSILPLRITTTIPRAADLTNRIRDLLADVKYYSILVVYPTMIDTTTGVLESAWHYTNIRLSDAILAKQKRTARIAKSPHIKLVPPSLPNKEETSSDQPPTG